MGKRRLNSKDKDRICELYENDKKTAPYIAEIFGVSKQAVHYFLDKNNITRVQGRGKTGRPKKISKDTVDKICDLYKKNIATTTQLALRFNISQMYIYMLLKQNGIEIQYLKLTKEQIKEICFLYQNGTHGVYKLAEIHGVAHTTIYRYLDKNNIKRRKYK